MVFLVVAFCGFDVWASFDFVSGSVLGVVFRIVLVLSLAYGFVCFFYRL